MQEETNTQMVANAMDGIDEQKPGIKARRILASISRKHGIEMDSIKLRFKETMQSEEAEKEDLPLDHMEEWAARKLLHIINDENDIDNYPRPIEQYCNLISELAIINDKMARVSVEISRTFGEKYNFVKALKEVDHARRLLENRMNNNFFGGEQDD